MKLKLNIYDHGEAMHVKFYHGAELWPFDCLNLTIFSVLSHK